MTKTESLIRHILGPIGCDVRPLVCAVDVTIDLLFVQQLSIDDIQVTKQVYPLVAKQLGKSLYAVSRQVERLANLCWDLGSPDLLEQIIGRQIDDIRAPRDMLFYLAFYSHLGISFFTATEQFSAP